MTDKKKAILIAGLIGGNVFLLVALRYSAKTIRFILEEYSKLYQIQSILERKVTEMAPEIWEDEELQNAVYTYEFLHIVEASNLKES